MNCPCCHGKLLAHFNSRGLYWYCVSCREVMPVIEKDESELVIPNLNKNIPD